MNAWSIFSLLMEGFTFRGAGDFARRVHQDWHFRRIWGGLVFLAPLVSVPLPAGSVVTGWGVTREGME